MLDDPALASSKVITPAEAKQLLRCGMTRLYELLGNGSDQVIQGWVQSQNLPVFCDRIPKSAGGFRLATAGEGVMVAGEGRDSMAAKRAKAAV